MPDDDRAFYRRRAEEELEYAQFATDESLVSYHYRLAGFYLELAITDLDGRASGPIAHQGIERFAG